MDACVPIGDGEINRHEKGNKMSIKRMLMLASMALAAIAFAAPAAAQGNVVLKDNNGTVLAPGAKVTATSTDLRTTVGDNTLACNKVTLHYEVLVNEATGKHVVLDPVLTNTHNAEAEECVTETPFGTFPNHITDAGTKQLTINTWGTGVTDSTFTSVTTTPVGPQHCEYTGPVHFQGVASGSDVANVGPSALTPSEGCEEGIIHGTATLETTGGERVNLHFVETP